MLLSPLGPRGKLRPEWEFDTELRAHSLAAGPGPVCGLWPLLAAALLSSPPPPPTPQLQSAHSAGGYLQRHLAKLSGLGPKALPGKGKQGIGAEKVPPGSWTGQAPRKYRV